VPACDAQCFAQGFQRVFCGRYTRKLAFCAIDANYFPLDSSRDWALGHTCAAPWNFGYGNPRWAFAGEIPGNELENYMKKKEKQLQRLWINRENKHRNIPKP
jgi:hypothetical protein